ncbi:hypothetical protein NDU88_003152 [Pleurodeles waltl]|uniref:Uncharacterized protein n=1 Tax=Pleurodeles waltl TaxID=8319 RepID=A0AAV7NIJ3_PLEWA|nr:hypothetical protein NDU88_003152 [Pleurodeles waltl]
MGGRVTCRVTGLLLDPQLPKGEKCGRLPDCTAHRWSWGCLGTQSGRGPEKYITDNAGPGRCTAPADGGPLGWDLQKRLDA